MTDPSVELALAELTRKIDVGFAKVDGQLALLIQRTQAMEARADGQDAALSTLDDRVDKVEATSVTRAEMDERAKRTLQVVAIIVAVLGAATGSGTALLIAFVTRGG